MSAPDPLLAQLGTGASIPRQGDGPVFPTAWAARAFALAVALNERGLFTWTEWSERLGAALAAEDRAGADDPQAYWLAWIAALEDLLGRTGVGPAPELIDLQAAWRHAAEATPHGRPIELSRP